MLSTHAPSDALRIWRAVSLESRGLIFHDLRRTAASDMQCAAIAESVARKISGHKTNYVFKRYDIVDTKDVEQAMEQMTGFYEAEDAKLEPRASRPN
jgi:integrase